MKRKADKFTTKSGAIEAEIDFRCRVYRAQKKPYNRKEVRAKVEKEYQFKKEGTYVVNEFGVKRL